MRTAAEAVSGQDVVVDRKGMFIGHFGAIDILHPLAGRNGYDLPAQALELFRCGHVALPGFIEKEEVRP